MKARWSALALSAALLFYLVTLGWRGVALVRDGNPVAVALGLGLLMLPLLGGWALVRELGFGRQTELLGRELEARGLLPEDTLPRRPSGRPDRVAADAWFEGFREEARQAPESWEAWFRLACAYDAAGDRRRARAAMRHAIGLHAAIAKGHRAGTQEGSPA
jgi:cytochrome c-type biogenesis protein CcmH/NrfG